MAWDSFELVLTEVAAVLANNTALQSYAGANLGGAFSVERQLRPNRKEINIKSLPLIMITSPRREPPGVKHKVVQLHNRVRTVRVYALFICQDAVAAQTHLIKVEELIEEALVRSTSLKDKMHGIESGSGANDEGRFHPAYGTVNDFEIWQRVR